MRWLAGLAVLLVAACSQPPGGAIGIVLPIEGPYKQWGHEMQQGIQLALDENPDPDRVVIVSDNGGTASGTTRAVEYLVERGANVIVGPLTTDNAITAGIVAQSLGVPCVVPGATGDGVVRENGGTLRLCYADAEAGRALARWARLQQGLQRVAVVLDLDSAYSLGLGEAFEREFQRQRGLVVGEVVYRGGGQDRATALDRAIALDVDGVLLAGYAPDIVVMVQQATRTEELKQIVLLGGDGWNGAGVPQVMAGRVAGGYFTRHFNPADVHPRVSTFVNAYEAKNLEPPSDPAALGYDAANVVLSVHAPELHAAEILAKLRMIRGHSGVTGVLTIDPHGSATHKDIVLVQVHDPSVDPFVARLGD